jgi:diketogulonate reductase-like aldo/keto reductase
MPWVGYGTYRLGQRNAHSAVLAALQTGYRQVDTAFVYGGQTTEVEVGKALRDAINQKIITSRQDVFVTTKQWRDYHGYDASLKCLELSLERLQLDYVDCWMMHWPGPCWESKPRQAAKEHGSSESHKRALEEDEEEEEEDVWSKTKDGIRKDDIARLRGETWRAMEDAYRSGKTRSIAVSNFTIQHLQALKKTATLWPPAINQIEIHPYYPQNELVEYCHKEGIVVQAYASLGGQDGTKAKWKKLGGKLLESVPVLTASNNLSTGQRKVTAGQVLLRWALERNCAIVPKTVNRSRMRENANLFDFKLSQEDSNAISKLVENVNKDEGRICWRTEPLRLLDFD